MMRVESSSTVAGFASKKSRVVEVALPRYVRRRPTAPERFGFYFEVPTWAKLAGCPVASCSLGHDQAAAIVKSRQKLAEFDAWMSSRDAIPIQTGPRAGSLDHLIARYKSHRNYADNLRSNTRAFYDGCLRFLSAFRFADGDYAGVPLGQLPWEAITKQLVDSFIDVVLIKIVIVDGKPMPKVRRRHTRSIVSTAATMWRTAAIALGLKGENPFLGHRIKGGTRETQAATADQLCDVIVAADNAGRPYVGTILLCIYECIWRPEHVVREFLVEHYRPPDHADDILITDAKNNQRRWRPLFDYEGKPQYPALIQRLDLLKGTRTTGHMFSVDSSPDGEERVPTMVTIRKWFRDIRDQTPHKHLTLTTFRHGAMTECGEAGLSASQIKALSLHRTTAVMNTYIHNTSDGQEMSQSKRLALRNNRRAHTRGSKFLAGDHAEDE